VCVPLWPFGKNNGCVLTIYGLWLAIAGYSIVSEYVAVCYSESTALLRKSEDLVENLGLF